MSEIGSVIRRVALAVPLVASQSGCSSDVLLARGSCDGFVSQQGESRVPITADAGFGDGGALANECQSFCETALGNLGGFQCAFDRNVDGGRGVVCSYRTMCTGRYPEGFELPEPDDCASIVGRYFATAAAAEAASVVAFERMAAEIVEHCLPARLAKRARRAAVEEARHHRTTAALARRFGARAARAHVADIPPRTLFEMALENAREGIVRETLGAVIGHFQSRHAHDDRVRRAMRRIAAEETSHAVLSWDLDACARRRLSALERAALDNAVHAALDDGEQASTSPVHDDLVRLAGLPAPPAGRALLEAARREIFAPRVDRHG